MPFSSERQRRYLWEIHPEVAKKWTHKYGSKAKKKKKGDGYKRMIDNKMRWQGDTDTEKKIIRINKKKSKRKTSIIDTIVHEEMHAVHPRMHEKTVYEKTKKKVKKLKKEQKARLYKKYDFKKAERRLGVVY